MEGTVNWSLWKNLCKYKSSMIIAGLKANLRAFSPWLIYNSTCWACQVRSGISARFCQISLTLAACLRTWCSIPHIPAPSSVLAWSIFLWLQKSPNKALLKGLYRLEIRSSGGSASDRWNLAIRWHLSCKWLSLLLWKTWRLGWSHPSSASGQSPILCKHHLRCE